MKPKALFTEEVSCRACGCAEMDALLHYGRTPLSDRLLTHQQLASIQSGVSSEPLVPLTLVFCRECSLVQLKETVDPNVLYREDYPYYSSVSDSLVRHFAESAEALIRDRELDESSFVVEVASNDGYMLRNFIREGIPALGIDPALGPAETASRAGVPTICAFFDTNLAEQLESEGRQADLLLANNVLAHVPDLAGFLRGVNAVLKEDGLAVFEVHSVASLVDHSEFDTVYHQHLCYFSATSLYKLFRKHGLFLNHIAQIPTYGGSLRLIVEKHEAVQDSVELILGEEAAKGLDQRVYYQRLARKAEEIKNSLRELLWRLKKQGYTIAAYGAAAKAATFLSYTGIDGDSIEYVVDLNSFKQGCYMGGNHLPIVHPSRLLAETPAYLLLLAWNFANEIIGQQAEYRKRGGRFLIPVPEPMII
jgi:hypothetical protein